LDDLVDDTAPRPAGACRISFTRRKASRQKIEVNLLLADLAIERLSRQAGVSRAGYYPFWRKSASRQHDTTVRDAIQRLP
jgi:hypothetical protein